MFREPGDNDAATAAILANPKFKTMVRARSSLGWTLSLVMIVAYFALIAAVAFDKPLLIERIGQGPTSVGIVAGIGVILIAIVLVGIYVAVANTRFDAMSRELRAEIKR